MADYTEAVWKMKTSEPITLMTSGKGLLRAADPDQTLQTTPLFPSERYRETEDDVQRRCETLAKAVAAELDRRIPIPEAP